MKKFKKIAACLLVLVMTVICIPTIKADAADSIPTNTYVNTDADNQFVEYFMDEVIVASDTPRPYKYWMIYKVDNIWHIALTNDKCYATNGYFDFIICSGQYADFIPMTSSDEDQTFLKQEDWHFNVGSDRQVCIIASNYDVPYQENNKVLGTYFAASCDHDYYTQNDEGISDSNEAIIKAHVESTYTVTIPKHISLERETQKADYSIKVKGDIAYNEKITVAPDVSSFALKQTGKDDIKATITQNISDFTFADLSVAGDDGVSTTGNISTTGLTAGHWQGGFNFNITLKKVD